MLIKFQKLSWGILDHSLTIAISRLRRVFGWFCSSKICLWKMSYACSIGLRSCDFALSRRWCNCFYRVISKPIFGHEERHVELHVMTMNIHVIIYIYIYILGTFSTHSALYAKHQEHFHSKTHFGLHMVCRKYRNFQMCCRQIWCK